MGGFGAKEGSGGQITRVLNVKMGNFKRYSEGNGEPWKVPEQRGNTARALVGVAGTEDKLEGGDTAGFCDRWK